MCKKNYKYVVCLFAGGLAGGEADGASGGEGRTKASNPGWSHHLHFNCILKLHLLKPQIKLCVKVYTI